MVLPYGSSVIESILDVLRSEVPESALPFLHYCLEHAASPLTVETVARAHGLHRRALEYRFSDAGLASPGTWIAWSRLLVAIDQLEHTSKSQEQVALEFGYGTGGALRKTITRHLKVPGHKLRSPGAFGRAVVRFAQTLRSEPVQLKLLIRDERTRRQS